VGAAEGLAVVPPQPDDVDELGVGLEEGREGIGVAGVPGGGEGGRQVAR